MVIQKLSALVFVIAGLVALAVMYIATPIGASQPFNPTLDITAISDQAPGANADITIRTALSAGDEILGTYGLKLPPGSWSFAGDKKVPDGHVTAFGTLEVDEGCDSSIETYGPFNLLDENAGSGGGAPVAQWFGTITDFMDADPNTNWWITLVVDGSLNLGFTIDGFLTDAVLPPGGSLCTPQTFTLTICGLANPSSLATVCGSGSDPDVATNPASAGTYTWTGSFLSESGTHSAFPSDSVCIDTSCPTPTSTSTATATPTPGGATATATATPTATATTTPTATATATPTATATATATPTATATATPTATATATPTATATATATATPTAAATDTDGDGWTDAAEVMIGTDPDRDCGMNANPADFNNDGFFTSSDLSQVAAPIGQSVPPASARTDIDPDPPDQAITSGDLSQVAGPIGQACSPDTDDDGHLDAFDNCPTVPNSGQGDVNTNGIGNACDPADTDGDNFSDRLEFFAGTDPGDDCADDPSDAAWAVDFNNDTFITSSDLGAVAAVIGQAVPPAPARSDIDPDPPDQAITSGDLSQVAALIGQGCTP